MPTRSFPLSVLTAVRWAAFSVLFIVLCCVVLSCLVVKGSWRVLWCFGFVVSHIVVGDSVVVFEIISEGKCLQISQHVAIIVRRL